MVIFVFYLCFYQVWNHSNGQFNKCESHKHTNQQIAFFPLPMLLRTARLQQEQTSQSHLGLKHRHSQYQTSATCAFPQVEVFCSLYPPACCCRTLLSALGPCHVELPHGMCLWAVVTPLTPVRHTWKGFWSLRLSWAVAGPAHSVRNAGQQHSWKATPAPQGHHKQDPSLALYHLGLQTLMKTFLLWP